MGGNQIPSQRVSCWAKQAELVQPPLPRSGKNIPHGGSAAALLLPPGGSTSGPDSGRPRPHASPAALLGTGVDTGSPPFP